jgi:hypothetical protein
LSLVRDANINGCLYLLLESSFYWLLPLARRLLSSALFLAVVGFRIVSDDPQTPTIKIAFLKCKIRLSYFHICNEVCRGQLKCDGTRAEVRFRLSEKRTSPFKSAGASGQATTGRRWVRIRGSNAG